VALAGAKWLWRTVIWMCCELTDTRHGPSHPYVHCGRPIGDRSRAAYCSHSCRQHARLERDAQANDPRIAERAERRLRAIRQQRLADRNAEWVEVPS
jgi:hypothetical protein